LLLQIVPQTVEGFDGLQLLRVGFESAGAEQVLIVSQRRLEHFFQEDTGPRTGAGSWSLTPFFSNPRKSIRRR